jgi:prepilin peptidase CpaA
LINLDAGMSADIVITAVSVAGFAGLLLFAAASDIATMTIPNWVSIAAALLFPLGALAAGLDLPQIAAHLGAGAVAFAIGFALFSFGVMGGGDVKVITAASIWTGFSNLSPFALATAIAGGGLAIALILARKALAPAPSRPAYLNRLLEPKNGIPYAVAIAAGGLAVLPSLPIAGALLGRP